MALSKKMLAIVLLVLLGPTSHLPLTEIPDRIFIGSARSKAHGDVAELRTRNCYCGKSLNLKEARASRAHHIPALFRIHLSSTILRKESRSATEEKNFEYFSNYLWLFRTRTPMLRRRDLL